MQGSIKSGTTLQLNYFVKTVLDTQSDAGEEIECILKKSKFLDSHKHTRNEM